VVSQQTLYQVDMNPAFNSPPVPLRLHKDELLELWNYTTKCLEYGFIHDNEYIRGQRDREYFYSWHLKEIAHKSFYKLLATRHHPGNKKLSIKLLDPERRTLSIMFNRVPCTPYMLSLQERIIHQLTKT